MRKCLLLVLLATFVFGCATAPHNGYVLTGTVPEAWEGKPVVLMVTDAGQRYAADSAIITDGKFQIKGKFDIPRYCTLVIYLDPENRNDPHLILGTSLFLDTTAVDLVCEYSGTKPAFSITGGAAQAEFQRYLDNIEPMEKDRSATFSRYGAAYYRGENSQEALQLAREVTEKGGKVREYKMEYIKEHPGSVVSLYALREICSRYSELSMEEMNRFFAGLSPRLRESEMGKALHKKIQDRRIILGNAFPDTELKDAEGNLKKISDFVTPGRYTLVEFWASWCGPCRAEIPHMKNAYKKYHPKGFDIVSISIDSENQAWQGALKEEKMPWKQLLDDSHTAKEAFEVTGVPTSVLVDDQGRIYNLNARGGWLDLALEEIYN